MPRAVLSACIGAGCMRMLSCGVAGGNIALSATDVGNNATMIIILAVRAGTGPVYMNTNPSKAW